MKKPIKMFIRGKSAKKRKMNKKSVRKVHYIGKNLILKR